MDNSCNAQNPGKEVLEAGSDKAESLDITEPRAENEHEGGSVRLTTHQDGKAKHADDSDISSLLDGEITSCNVEKCDNGDFI